MSSKETFVVNHERRTLLINNLYIQLENVKKEMEETLVFLLSQAKERYEKEIMHLSKHNRTKYRLKKAFICYKGSLDHLNSFKKLLNKIEATKRASTVDLELLLEKFDLNKMFEAFKNIADNNNDEDDDNHDNDLEIHNSNLDHNPNSNHNHNHNPNSNHNHNHNPISEQLRPGYVPTAFKQAEILAAAKAKRAEQEQEVEPEEEAKPEPEEEEAEPEPEPEPEEAKPEPEEEEEEKARNLLGMFPSGQNIRQLIGNQKSKVILSNITRILADKRSTDHPSNGNRDLKDLLLSDKLNLNRVLTVLRSLRLLMAKILARSIVGSVKRKVVQLGKRSVSKIIKATRRGKAIVDQQNPIKQLMHHIRDWIKMTNPDNSENHKEEVTKHLLDELQKRHDELKKNDDELQSGGHSIKKKSRCSSRRRKKGTDIPQWWWYRTKR